MLLTRFRRVIQRIRTRGIGDTLQIAAYRIAGAPALPMFEKAARHTLALRKRARSPSVIIRSTLDWNFPYLQRPHHMARALAAAGLNVTYVTPASGYDRIFSVSAVEPRLYVTPHLQAALASVDYPILLVLSTDMRFARSDLEQVWRRGGLVIYDYLDAIDDTVSNAVVTPNRIALHHELLGRTDDTLCLASADSLFAELSLHRSMNLALVENGVDLSHFGVPRNPQRLDPAARAVLTRGRPVAGYFGALAHWIDYDLLRAASESLPHVDFVLIGNDYDGSRRSLQNVPANLHVLPPVDYAVLPYYGRFFDAALIPFKVNAITEATSPLKLFEYMALGLPIVSTPIREAFKYKSVRTAGTPSDFAAAVESALARRSDPDIQRVLASEAHAGSWAARARVVVSAVEDHLQGSNSAKYM